MEIQINLPAMTTISRASHDVEFDLTKLNAETIAQLVLHGLTQKVGDAAAGKSGDDALAAMQKVMDQLHEGSWTMRRSGGGSGRNALDRMMIAKARGMLKAHVDGYKDMTPAERDDAIWELIEQLLPAQQDKLKVAAERQIAMDKELNNLDLDI